MSFTVLFQPLALEQLEVVKRSNPKKWKKVAKCLALLETTPKHPGLNSHRYQTLDEVTGEKVWESYVENRTLGAYRIFWHYGPDSGEITVIAITPHP